MRALPILALLCAVGVADARPFATPYTEWANQAERAAPDALSGLAKRQPAFARVWFYGQIFDLGEPRIPEARKTALRPKLQAIVDGTQDPTLRRWLAAPDLAKRFGEVNGMREAWLANARAGDPTSPMLATVQRPEIATPIFYRYLYRAGLIAGGLSAVDAANLPLATARHLAAGRAIVTGDFDWWTDLAAFHGGAVPTSGPLDADDDLTRTLNARLRKDQRRVMRDGQAALHSARRRRPNSLYTALVLNLGAMAAGWGGQPKTERTLRVQVLQQVRPLEQIHLTAALLAGMIRLELAGPTPDAAASYLEELLALGPSARHRRPIAAMLIDALGALDKRRVALASREDLPAWAETLAIYFKVAEAAREPGVLAFAPAPLRAALPGQIARAHADAGRVARRRGRLEEAERQFGLAARALSAVAGQTVAAQRAGIERAEVLWALGREGDARAAVSTIVAQASGATLAAARGVLGGLRLAGGDPAPAFAHANAGLTAIRGVDAPAERAALHRLAGLALHAAGNGKPAADRLAQAARIAPKDPENARLHALALLDLGDVPGALQAVNGVPEPARAVMQGCLLTHASRHAEALKSLERLGQLNQPHQALLRIEGMLCQIAALLETGDVATARAALRNARAQALSLPEPAISWRIRAFEGINFASQKKWLDAAGVWRQALLGLGDLGAEGAARGALLDARSLAPPGRPLDLAEPLIDALLNAAKQDKKSATSHIEAALAIALQARQLAAAPRRSGLQEAQHRPAADRAGRRLMARVGALRRGLADPAVRGADRARLTQQLQRVRSGLTSSRADLAQGATAWGSYLAPQPAAPTTLQAPAGQVHIYYHFNLAAGHVFVSAPGVPLRHYPLPSGPIVAQAIAPALAVITDPAEKPDWSALAQLDLLMPFLKDKALQPALEKSTWWIVPDGPLMSFPFGALVTSTNGPKFLADHVDLRRAAGPQQPAPAPQTAGVGAIGARDKETRGVLSAAGSKAEPTPANPATFQADLAARGTQWIAVPADLDEGVLTLTGDAGGRLSEADLAFGPGGVQAVVLSRATVTVGPGDGIRRMLAALLHRGVRAVVWVIGRTDPDVDFGIRVAERLGNGEALGDALRAQQAAVRASTSRHPYRWARWLLSEPLPLKALKR